MGAEGHEPVLLDPVVALQHPGYGLAQVVEADDLEHPAQVLQAPGDPLKKRRLGLAGVGPVQLGPGGLRADHDDLGGLAPPGEVDVGAVEVHLRLPSCRVVLGDVGLHADAHLPAAGGHVGPNGGLRDRGPELVSDPLVDPPRGVALLTGSVGVCAQDLVDEGADLRGQGRTGPLRCLALRRDGRRHGLAHDPSMDPVGLSETPDGRSVLGIATDKLEQLHPSHPFSSLSSRGQPGG